MFRLNLFLFICLFICLSSLFALELKNLCEERIYLNNAVINSFYQLKLEKDLEPVSNYLNDEEPSKPVHEAIINQIYSNRLNLSEIVKQFQSLDPKPKQYRLARARRSPRYLAIVSSVPSMTTEPNTEASVVPNEKITEIPTLTTLQQSEEYIETIDKMQKPINRLRMNLELLESNRISEDWVSKEDLKLELESVNQDMNETQTSVFQNQVLEAFYERPIAMLDGLTVERNQSVYLDDTVTGTLKFSLYIPYHDQNRTLDENCVNISSLPLFYQTETLSSRFKDLSNSQFIEELEKVKNKL